MNTGVAAITTELNDINHVAVNLWYRGCTVGCAGCCNPELQEFGEGMSNEELVAELEKRRRCADWLVHIGGNPVEQPDELLRIAKIADGMGYKQYVFTGFDEERLTEIFADKMEEASKYLSFVKVGKYDEQRPRSICPSFHFASVNQRVVKPTLEGFLPVYFFDETTVTPVGSICPEL